MSLRWVALLGLTACTGGVGPGGGPAGDDDDDNGGGGGGGGGGGADPVRIESSHFADRTNNSGRLKIEFNVPDKVESFQVTGDADLFVSFDEIVDPNGDTVFDWEDWLYSDESLTLAWAPQRRTTAIDWPVRKQDGPLAGGMWTVWLATTNSSYEYIPDIDVDVFTDLKFDDDLSAGHVDVQIVWANGVDDQQEVVDAVDEATLRWAEVWSKAGIDVSFDFVASDLDPNLGFALSGDDDVKKVSKDKKDGAMQLIVGETVVNDDYIFGLSAGIPGTVEPSPNTFVVLGWLTHSGRDAVFDADEIRLMGETMAHECGHYTGLFHPVEFYYDAWDALDDTEHCTNRSSCESDLGNNFMFPYPICTFSGCDAQGAMTGDQAEVMNRYVSVL